MGIVRVKSRVGEMAGMGVGRKSWGTWRVGKIDLMAEWMEMPDLGLG